MLHTMSCTSRAAKTLSNRSRPSSDARVFLVPRLHDRGEWFMGYRVWDLGNSTFSLEPWHTLGLPCRLHSGRVVGPLPGSGAPETPE